MTDLSAKFAGLSSKLDTVIERLDSLVTAVTAGGSIDAAPIVAAIEGLRGTGPDNTLHSVNQSIWNMVGPAPGHTLSDVYEVLDSAISSGEGITLYNMVDLIYQLLVKSNSALGAEPQSSLELATVRGLLWAILSGVSQNGIIPDGNLTSYAKSSDTFSTNGRRFLVWGDITGLIESEDGTSLTPESSWEGYQIYIQTAAPSAIQHDATTPAESIDPFAVNSWIPLSGNHTLAFSVDSSYLVTGYLRVPTGEWLTFTTVPLTAAWHQVNDWSPLPSLQNDPTICTRDTAGVMVRHVSGPRMRFMPNNSESVFYLLEVEQEGTIVASYSEWRVGTNINMDGYAPTTFQLKFP